MMQPAERMRHVRRSMIRRIVDAAPPGSVHLGLGEIRLPLHPNLQKAAQRALDEGDVYYTPNAGLPELREAIGALYGRGGDSVCVTNGAAEAIYAVLTAYVGTGDRVILPSPAYPAYETIVKMCCGECDKLALRPEEGFRIDLDALEARLSGARALVLCNPSNPLGTQFSDDEVHRIGELCARYGVLLVADEVYRELWLERRCESFAACPGDVIVVSGLSKSHALTGWRIGWACGRKELVAPVIDVHQYVATCAPVLSQRVALYALRDDAEEAVSATRGALRRNMNILRQGLQGLSLAPLAPDAAPYVWARATSPEAHQRLLDFGVITIPAAAFGWAGDWIRISCGVSEHVLREGVRRIWQALAEDK